MARVMTLISSRRLLKAVAWLAFTVVGCNGFACRSIRRNGDFSLLGTLCKKECHRHALSTMFAHDGVVESHRRRLLALIAAIPSFGASLPPVIAADSKCQPTEVLLDVRTQIDLAVQASQAWEDAAIIANDELLNEDNLRRSFSSGCKSSEVTFATVLESIQKMRGILAKNGRTTEDAITFMQYGTSARTAVDAYLNELAQ